MIRTISIGLAILAGAIFGLALTAPAANAQQAPRMLCESIHGEPAMCLQPGLTEAFVVQVLGGECVAGQQWNWGPRGISVRDGCRAVFGYRTAATGNGGGYYPPPPPPGHGSSPGYGRPGEPILCASMNFQPNRCPMDTSGGVTIGMITNQPCRQGQTWGWDRGGVWVTGNCRAYFKAAGGGGGIGTGAGYPGGNPDIGNGAGMANGSQFIECSSWQFQPARCPTRTRNGVELVVVLGGECIRNRSWGWDENAIWVSNGCRARFHIKG